VGKQTFPRLAAGKQAFLWPAAGKQLCQLQESKPFPGWQWERQSFSGQLQVNSRSMNTDQS